MRFYFIFIFFAFVQLLNAQQSFTINSINIEGNKTTKEQTILRELAFEIGDTLSLEEFYSKLNQSELNISSQWLFNFIDFIPIIKNYSIDLNIKVVERWYVWPYPILEISERNFNVFWDSLKASNFTDYSRINYGVFLNWYNFRGRNELLKIKFRKGYKEHYLFEYDIPYINRSKTLGAIFIYELFRMRQFHYNTKNNKLLYTSVDNDYLKNNNLIFTLQYKNKLNTTHRLNIKHSTIKCPEDILSLNTNFLPNQRSTFQYSQLDYHYENEKRNSVSYPTKGNFNELILSLYNGISNEFNNISLSGKTEHHFNLSPRLFFGSSLKFKYQSNSDLPYILNESLGFEDYLRGYEYYVIDGQHFGISKSAIKYELIPKTLLQLPYFKREEFNKSFYSVYLSIFADMGKVIDQSKQHITEVDNPLNNLFLFSQGVSLDIVTYYDKLLRLEYSRNHLNEWGFFIHFSNPF
ncbi:MAG: POTRA domain-containing protein [Flavobacteriales bacterium]